MIETSGELLSCIKLVELSLALFDVNSLLSSRQKPPLLHPLIFDLPV
uniref:Uncharacterized protein n=1 Tax=Rhizophora mucronata TaxID=61149 RepID=A0A2P2NPW6_RHIMU